MVLGQRRTFSHASKLEAVKLIRARGVSVAQAARNPGIHENVPRKWTRQQAADPKNTFSGHGQMKPEQQEVAQHPGISPLRWMCGAVGVSHGTFYAWLCRLRRHARTRDSIELPYQRSDLRRPAGLARRAGRRSRLRSAADRTVDAKPCTKRTPAPSAPAFVYGDAFAPNDSSEHPRQQRPGAAALNLFSRRVVGWSMNARMTSALVADALMMAIWRRGCPTAVLYHSDRGSGWRSEAFQRLLTDQGIICGMRRAGNVWVNAAVESFFSSMKTERVTRKIYRTCDDARADAFDYVERFYNPYAGARRSATSAR
jgi:putative transposase